MNTDQRLEKAKYFLSAMEQKRGYDKQPIPNVEKVLVQLFNICVNQQAELSLLQQQIDGIKTKKK